MAGGVSSILRQESDFRHKVVLVTRIENNNTSQLYMGRRVKFCQLVTNHIPSNLSGATDLAGTKVWIGGYGDRSTMIRRNS